MQFPLIKKSTLNSAIARHNKVTAELRKEHQRELDVVKKDVSELVQKLTTVTITPDHDCSRYRLCVDIDPRMVRGCLSWGNDSAWLDHFAGSIAHKIKQQLMSANMVRHRDEFFKRGYGSVNFNEPPKTSYNTGSPK